MSQERLTESLCFKLPAKVQNAAMGTSVSDTSSDVQSLASFLQTNLRADEFRKYVCEEKYDRTFTLTRLKKASTQKPRAKKTQLSLKERRQLGLYSLKRKGMKYTDFLPLHNLWKDYFYNYLEIDQLQSRGFTADPENRQWDDVNRLLLKADYHGAIISVQKSKCSSLVGKTGIIVFDTKNTFKMLGQDNILRTIPKQSSVFQLKMGGYTFTILGQHFCIKPSERSSKKIKSFMNLDL